MKEKSKIPVVISCGQGALYFPVAAHYIFQTVEPVGLICGYVPKNSKALVLKILSFLKGRDISAAIGAHKVYTGEYKVYTCVFAEVVYEASLLLRCRCHALSDWLLRMSWKCFGFMSRKYLKGARIFHVRSGAGHGGSIACAKRMGLKVLVDHSIAHPLFLEKQLSNSCELSPFWKIVDEDCRWADCLVVNSDFVKKTFVEQGWSPDKIKVNYLGVRSDFFGARLKKLRANENKKEDNGPLKLLFIGSVCERKGCAYLLEAAKILTASGFEYSLEIVGGYDASSSLVKGVDKNLPVRFLGSAPHEKLKDFLEEADVFLFPSLAEGCAQTGMEALGAGLCVVATEESGFPIIDGVNGCIVPAKNAQALADKIVWLNQNRRAIVEYGERAASTIQSECTWEKYGERMRTIYEDLIKG